MLTPEGCSETLTEIRSPSVHPTDTGTARSNRALERSHDGLVDCQRYDAGDGVGFGRDVVFERGEDTGADERFGDGVGGLHGRRDVEVRLRRRVAEHLGERLEDDRSGHARTLLQPLCGDLGSRRAEGQPCVAPRGRAPGDQLGSLLGCGVRSVKTDVSPSVCTACSNVRSRCSSHLKTIFRFSLSAAWSEAMNAWFDTGGHRGQHGADLLLVLVAQAVEKVPGLDGRRERARPRDDVLCRLVARRLWVPDGLVGLCHDSCGCRHGTQGYCNPHVNARETLGRRVHFPCKPRFQPCARGVTLAPMRRSPVTRAR